MSVENQIPELKYPLTFREADAKTLGSHLLHRHNVNLVGMKRVGISNFLRFFLYRDDVVSEYISTTEKHLFIPVDLNDLVEREVYPFWVLTMKRIVDTVNRSYLPNVDKKELESLFMASIQSQDQFLLIDSVRKSLISILDSGVMPTLFFLRFDRMKDVVNQQFFDNLQGLKDATHQKLSYVFTGYRTLDQLSPKVFTKASLSVFLHPQCITPASTSDMEVILTQFKMKYELKLPSSLETELLRLCGGHVQYLQLALILLNENGKEFTKDNLEQILYDDERILLMSEELYEGLEKSEKEVVREVAQKTTVSQKKLSDVSYLRDVGLLVKDEGDYTLFSPLFDRYITENTSDSRDSAQNVHFSKKEHLLYSFLEAHKEEICERDDIVEQVWPEYSEYGVSDWAIDRLVARVRAKLKQQGSNDEIYTIRTRGYKLTSSS